jgi:hypothetical protein
VRCCAVEPVVSALSCHLVVVVVIRSLMLVLVLTAQLFVDYRDNGECAVMPSLTMTVGCCVVVVIVVLPILFR